MSKLHFTIHCQGFDLELFAYLNVFHEELNLKNDCIHYYI